MRGATAAPRTDVMNEQYDQPSPAHPQGGATLGVIGTSLKPAEQRVPIHPDHFERIPEELRARIIIEAGYGDSIRDRQTLNSRSQFGRVASRSDTIAGPTQCCIPKPQHDDLRAMRAGQTLWGWPHCVQDAELTQIAIDTRLTHHRVRGECSTGAPTRQRASTCSTRTTSSPATVPCSTRSNSRGQPEATASG